VAPWWPHGRRSRAWCRVAGKRTSCRRYGQTRTLGRRPAARLHDLVEPQQASARGRARPSRRRASPGVGQEAVAGAAAARSAQRPPRRLNRLACLRSAAPAGLREDRRRR